MEGVVLCYRLVLKINTPYVPKHFTIYYSYRMSVLFRAYRSMPCSGRLNSAQPNSLEMSNITFVSTQYNLISLMTDWLTDYQIQLVRGYEEDACMH